MVGGIGGLERCPRERPGLEPEIARRARVPTGKVGAKSKPEVAAGEPCPAGAEAVDSESDAFVRLRGPRGCGTADEGNSHGKGECRTR